VEIFSTNGGQSHLKLQANVEHSVAFREVAFPSIEASSTKSSLWGINP